MKLLSHDKGWEVLLLVVLVLGAMVYYLVFGMRCDFTGHCGMLDLFFPEVVVENARNVTPERP